jgi:hypothetical protein
MSRPAEVDDYSKETKKVAEKHEQRIVDLEFGEDSTLPPDSARPSYLFKSRANSLCRVLRLALP